MKELIRILKDRIRALLLRLSGAAVTGKVSVGPGLRCSRPSGVVLKNRVTLEDHVSLKLVTGEAELQLHEHVFVGRNTTFDVMDRVVIGAHTLFGPGCTIVDHNHGIKPDLRIDQQPCEPAPVSIGEDVWCGANVVILPGVTVGRGAVIAAGAVVHRDVAAYEVVGGVPAKHLRWRREPARD